MKESQIEKLMSCFKLKNKPIEEQMLIKSVILRWFISLVSKPQKYVFVVYGSIGYNRLSFFDSILPKSLMENYGECCFIRGKDDEKELATKLLVVDIDPDDRTKRRWDRYSWLNSQDSYKLKENTDSIPRTAVMAASAKSNKFLKKAPKDIVFIPINVNDIDMGIYYDIDRNGLFVELFTLYWAGYTAELTEDEIAYLKTP